MENTELIPGGIFGHVFESGGQAYFYDVHQNEILEIDSALAAVLPLWNLNSRAEIEAEFAGEYQLSKIRASCDTIVTAQKEEGLFLAHRPLLVPPDPGLSEPGVCDSNLQHLVLTVTDRCNLRCKYCLHGADLDWVRSHGQKSMSVEIALRALEYFLDRSDKEKTPFVSFYGGEALLEFDLIESVIAAARNDARGKEAVFVIDTNGMLLDDRAIDLVIREKMFLQISLDGPQEVHDRNRVTIDGGESFQKIIDSVDRLLAKDPLAAERLSFIATMAPPVDLQQLAEFFAHFPPFEKHGIKSQPNVRVNTANLRGQNWPGAKEGAVSLAAQIKDAREQYLQAVESCTREALSPVIRALFEPELIGLYHRSRSPLGEKYTPGGNCMPGQRKLHVATDGRFQPCERTGSMMRIGDIESGIQSAEVKGVRDRFHQAVHDRCGNCWALRMCGVCFAVQAENADLEAGEFPIPESACEAVRQSKESTLKMMVKVLQMPEECRDFLDETIIS